LSLCEKELAKEKAKKGSAQQIEMLNRHIANLKKQIDLDNQVMIK